MLVSLVWCSRIRQRKWAVLGSMVVGRTKVRSFCHYQQDNLAFLMVAIQQTSTACRLASTSSSTINIYRSDWWVRVVTFFRCRHFLFSMGKWPDFEYHGRKWLTYDWSSHPSLMVWCIELTSSGHIWSFPTCLKMVIFSQNHHFQAYRKWPNTTTITKFNASNHLGGPQGWLRWVINRLVIFKPFCDMIFKI